MIRVGLVLRVEVRTWESWLPALQDLSKTGYGGWGRVLVLRAIPSQKLNGLYEVIIFRRNE